MCHCLSFEDLLIVYLVTRQVSRAFEMLEVGHKINENEGWNTSVKCYVTVVVL